MVLSATSVGTTASLTVTVSATGGAGRVLLFIHTESNGATSRTVSSISGLSGTWHNRAQILQGASRGQASELWYADFAATTSGNVTVTMSGAVDGAVILAIFISSSTSAAISFDTNASLPATATGAPNGATVERVTASTNSTAPLVLISTGVAANIHATAPTPVSTGLGSVGAVATNFEFADAWGGAPGQMAGTSCGATVNSSANGYCMIVDALTEPVAPTGNTGLNSGGLGSGGLGSGGLH